MEKRIKNPETNKMVVTENDLSDTSAKNGVAKKKYHSSAMYAASKWQKPVAHIKPFHEGLNL
jgi:hypothetical protein